MRLPEVLAADFAVPTCLHFGSHLFAEQKDTEQPYVQAYPEGALAYFNSGEAAGASQPRKHLQILPASLDGQPTAPLTFQETILSAAEQACVKPKEAIPLHQLPFQSFGATLPKQ